MGLDEIVYFFKYIGKQILETPVYIFKNVMNGLKHPSYVWIYLMFIIWVYLVFFKKNYTSYYNVAMILALIVFLIWREYEAGQWKFEYREKMYSKIRKKAKESSNDEQNNNNPKNSQE